MRSFQVTGGFNMGADESNNAGQGPTRNSSHRAGFNFSLLLWAGVLAFVLGVLGNLTAAWIQEEVIEDAFTTNRLLIILTLTVAGILGAAWIESRRQNGMIRHDQEVPTGGVNLSRIRLWWSKFKIRGRDVHVNDVKSLQSEIDIDTRASQEDENMQ